jgi:hypothetical protein
MSFTPRRGGNGLGLAGIPRQFVSFDEMHGITEMSGVSLVQLAALADADAGERREARGQHTTVACPGRFPTR